MGVSYQGVYVRSNNNDMQLVETNELFDSRMAVLFVDVEDMANSIAQGKVGLEVCAVKHVVDAM
jgi:hypothetical protein